MVVITSSEDQVYSSGIKLHTSKRSSPACGDMRREGKDLATKKNRRALLMKKVLKEEGLRRKAACFWHWLMSVLWLPSPSWAQIPHWYFSLRDPRMPGWKKTLMQTPGREHCGPHTRTIKPFPGWIAGAGKFMHLQVTPMERDLRTLGFLRRFPQALTKKVPNQITCPTHFKVYQK